MKNFVILILFYLLISSAGFSQGLAIRPFVDIGESELGELVADYISVELIRSRQLSVISPSSVSAQLKEAKIIESGCSSAECNIAIAELLQTEYLVFGTVEKKENGDYTILYQLYRTIRKSVIHMKEVSMTFDFINNSVKEIAEDILHWTTGQKMELIEHPDYDNINLSTLHGKVTGIYESSYLLNVGIVNGLRDNSFIFVMDGDEIGAVLQISTLLPNTSTARIIKIKKKGFKIQVGSPFYIPERISARDLMARHKIVCMVNLSASQFGVRYEYGMRYRFKPSIELSLGPFSNFAVKGNWYLTDWFSAHIGFGLFHGETEDRGPIEMYPSLLGGVQLSIGLPGFVIEVDLTVYGQMYGLGHLGFGVTF
ncbi:hypothetical protein KAI78_01640 [bacterium]|nr:hypothetical protein [bacterium]